MNEQNHPASIPANRRQFLGTTAAGFATGALGGPLFAPRSSRAAAGRSAPMTGSPSVPLVSADAPRSVAAIAVVAQIVALSDCNVPRAESFKAKHKGKWPIYQDYRKVLDRKDIDAVIVATGEFRGWCRAFMPARRAKMSMRKSRLLFTCAREGARQRRAALRSRPAGWVAATVDGNEPRGLRVGS